MRNPREFEQTRGFFFLVVVVVVGLRTLLETFQSRTPAVAPVLNRSSHTIHVRYVRNKLKWKIRFFGGYISRFWYRTRVRISQYIIFYKAVWQTLWKMLESVCFHFCLVFRTFPFPIGPACRWYKLHYLQFRICATGAIKSNKSPGMPSLHDPSSAKLLRELLSHPAQENIFIPETTRGRRVRPEDHLPPGAETQHANTHTLTHRCTQRVAWPVVDFGWADMRDSCSYFFSVWGEHISTKLMH